jgi:hypothetical protein
MTSLFLFALDQTLVATIQPQIYETFLQPTKLPWLAVAYEAGNAGSTLQLYYFPSLPAV